MLYKFKAYKKSSILRNHLHMGGKNPKGEQIAVNSLYLERGGKPWIGVMGEFHFSRYCCEEWYRELCKMKAGGITIVATYLFWIYHEELEGEFDFSGDRNVRRFVEECRRAGLEVILRIGPWAHGECRNGGFPDWLLEKPYLLRNNNEGYLEKTRIWYRRIYEQVEGLFYKDGGNIIGIQLENENPHDAPHLARLKEIALEEGYDVPLYTVTGWNNERGAEIPVDEVLPVFGGYPEAPWLSHTERLQPLCHFFFSSMRNEAAIDEELKIKHFAEGWELPYERYPFATCELGGGVEINHLRRPRILPMDVYTLSLIKLGCGNNLIGYYMYHGGTNKIGRLSTLNEYHNGEWTKDCLILSYDFQAPLSEYGEAREHYGLLNILHLFIHDFGDRLAPMEYAASENEVSRYDTASLRYCMRTDGKSGFVFISHYQRLTKLADVDHVIFDTGSVIFPEMSIRGETAFFLPFHMELGENLLVYAAAQPLCRIGQTYFFAAVEGIEPEYRFADGEFFKTRPGASLTAEAGAVFTKGNIKVVTLTWEEAGFARKLSGELYIGCGCNLYEEDGRILAVEEGRFRYLKWTDSGFEEKWLGKPLENAEIRMKQIAEAPFTLPYEEELHINGRRQLTWKKVEVTSDRGFIEIKEVCDAAQLYVDGRLAADEFYYGAPWRIPARLLFGKECYLVMSELKKDCYIE